jgi:2,3-bisphosphoglycerate-independent phosphoglycerate mutase
MPFKPKIRPVVLCVLDGWGHREDSRDNAVAEARAPNFRRLMKSCPHAFLDASNEEVGLPHGQMGNSEVGHMNLGAGRTVDQELLRIGKALDDGSVASGAAMRNLIAKLKETGGTCHLMGLVSPGGVHAMQDHIAALARILDKAGVGVAVHAYLDGRDTPPQSAEGYLAKFLADTRDLANMRIATVSGRYYAMDRDKRWERIERAYDALVDARGKAAPDAEAAVTLAYGRGETDEFVLPTVIDGYAGVKDGDGVLMANFRGDRARQILTALLDPDFDGFARRRVVAFAAAAGMVEYSAPLARLMSAIFPPQRLTNILGEIVAKAGMAQLRIAETEKYAHVTFFFNGGEETPFPREDRILVPSPKVATYDLKPEMSAIEVTDRLVEAIGSGKYDFVLVNYANADMVGHTGKLDAAIKAIETVDACLGRLEAAVRKAGGALLITADHGNAELMRDPETGAPHTAHTLDVVPVLLVGAPKDMTSLHDGRLADVAPTLLEIFGLDQPAEMTGRSLIARGSEGKRSEGARASA